MIVVKKSIDIVNTVLGMQEIDTEKVYRPLSFCFFADVDGKHIVYNTLTGEILELDDQENTLLHEASVKPSGTSKELIKKWYLVPLEHDDIEFCDEVVSFAKVFEKRDGIKEYTVFTTTDCNARCFYCYENGCKKEAMTTDIAQNVAEYIIANAPSGKTVHLSWFGGEPLCNTEVMDIISDALGKAEIKFTAHITSNGYLLDAATVDKAAQKWNIKTAQITLDGTEEIYNLTKAYVYSDDNPFETVTDNIELLLKSKINVSIRINIGSHNIDDLYRLVDWISDRYRGFNNVCIYPRAIMDYDKDRARNNVDFKEVLALEEYCFKKGLLAYPMLIKDGIRANSCIADSDSAITVLPDGRLGKCEHFIDKYHIGDVHNGITNVDTVQSFKRKLNCKELCKGCALYPVCIRLEKCPDVTSSVCDDAYIMVEKAHMARSLEYTYKKLKESK